MLRNLIIVSLIISSLVFGTYIFSEDTLFTEERYEHMSSTIENLKLENLELKEMLKNKVVSSEPVNNDPKPVIVVSDDIKTYITLGVTVLIVLLQIIFGVKIIPNAVSTSVIKNVDKVVSRKVDCCDCNK